MTKHHKNRQVSRLTLTNTIQRYIPIQLLELPVQEAAELKTVLRIQMFLAVIFLAGFKMQCFICSLGNCFSLLNLRSSCNR